MDTPANNPTQDHLIASIRWISMMSSEKLWGISLEELAILLGRIEVKAVIDLQHRAELGLPVILPHDTLERLSLLLGIWKSLNLLVPDGRQDLAFKWFNKPNGSQILKNMSIKNYLLESRTIEEFYTVKRYLDSQNNF